VQSQVKLHAPYGGVVPELASRDHLRNVSHVLNLALTQAKVSLDEVDGIAVTCRPGLTGALLVGVQAARGLAWSRNKPLVGRFQEQLVFLGIVPSPQDMADFYAACDLLALPSDTECFALVQVEAMLCGTPVVMTDTPGGRVPVQLTGMGKIVPRNDWRALGEGIVELSLS
jgi:glycosyltransferase involved in cell wall biosynthesis